MDKLYFAKVRNSAKIPTKREEDGCYDIYADFEYDSYLIPPHNIRLLPTGISSAFSNKYRLAISDRGSNTKSYLHTMAGQIDSGYRGEIFVALLNTSDFPVVIGKQFTKISKSNQGLEVPYSKAIAQVALEFVPQDTVEEISLEDLLSMESERGLGNLGSSGK